MKTTLNIDDSVMASLRREAAREDKTISELVETALRMLLKPPRRRAKLPTLPAFRGGPFRVDVADREALYRVMEEG